MPGSENLPDQQIRWALRLTRVRPFLKGGLIGTLLLLSAIFWTYTVYGLLDYLVFSAARDKQWEAQVTQDYFNWPSLKKLNEPQPLNLSAPQALSNIGSGINYLEEMQNPNGQWKAVFNYVWSDGENIKKGQDFILPGGKKYLLVNWQGSRGQVSFNLEDISWQKTDARDVEGDYRRFMADRLNFVFENIKYLPPVGDLPGRLNFSLTNKSAFGFWQAKILVLTRRGEEVTGLDIVALDRLASGEKRQVEINWPRGASAYSGVDIVPDIDILDADVFMPL